MFLVAYFCVILRENRVIITPEHNFIGIFAAKYTFDGKEKVGKLGAAQWSVYVNLFLLAVKFLTAIYTGSLGIIAELIHSFFDLMASC